jgi:hypothetical protein
MGVVAWERSDLDVDAIGKVPRLAGQVFYRIFPAPSYYSLRSYMN